MPDSIYLTLSSDNYYAPMVATLLKSIEQNYQSAETIEVYIIDDGISATNRKRIEASVRADLFHIHWHPAKSVVPATVKLPADKSALPMTTYLRLYAPYIVPPEARRLLYLDVDMLVLGNIADLWHTDLRGCVCAAVQDVGQTVSCAWAGIRNYRELGMDPDTKYFNAGVLLMDVQQWREADIANRVIRCMNDNLKHVTCADQYGLNVVLMNQWVQLDPRWNWFSTLPHAAPYLIHFVSVDKPIFAACSSDKHFLDLFFTYMRQTSWKNFQPISNQSRFFHKVYRKGKKISMHMLARL
ncbi:glycosyltransferase family 8 protein [Spirosoma montaniterrae]|uniref:Glycosyl transferase n=1 Tax=Spirosoma montaniterrae TaxID=1178516 RepID=A0A1P9WRE3_9BACT|nr:glycosyltransferase family 8 protein [Spirosoma montaniterrae]AQG77942.1 hypothetical protein AWR27_00390 [Spirosoma montaniterrae]